MPSGGRVQFDFEGSLRMARQLWALAGTLANEDRARESDFETAKARWEGSYGDEFVSRRENERTDRIAVESALREDAQLWAQAWAGAMDQQNRNNRMAHIDELAEELRDDRGWLERNVGDRFTGDDSFDQAVSQTPEPAPVPVPTPPLFSPTATERVY